MQSNAADKPDPSEISALLSDERSILRQTQRAATQFGVVFPKLEGASSDCRMRTALSSTQEHNPDHIRDQLTRVTVPPQLDDANRKQWKLERAGVICPEIHDNRNVTTYE